MSDNFKLKNAPAPKKKTLTVHLIGGFNGVLETAGPRVSDQVCGKYIRSHKRKEKLKGNRSDAEQDGKVT